MQMKSRNIKQIRAERKALYERKAWLVGMTLDGYCYRFGVRKIWEETTDDAEQTEGGE